MPENATVFVGMSPITGKPVHLAFGEGRLTSDASPLLASPEIISPSGTNASAVGIAT
jgi:hypothetical protein